MARRRKGDAEGQAAVQTTANQGADTRKRAATKRERVTRAELRERRGHEVKEPKVHVSLRERFASLGDSLRELVQGHPRAVFAVLAVVVAIVMIYGPARGYYVATRTNEELSAYYNALVEQNEDLRDDLDRLQTREGIEDEAHKRGLVYDGEKIVQVEGLTGNVSLPLPEVKVEDCRPWYTRVLDFIFGYEFGVWQ